MAEKTAHMFVVLLSLFAIFLRYVRAQMNSNANQGIHCITRAITGCTSTLVSLYISHLMKTTFNFLSKGGQRQFRRRHN